MVCFYTSQFFFFFSYYIICYPFSNIVNEWNRKKNLPDFLFPRNRLAIQNLYCAILFNFDKLENETKIVAINSFVSIIFFVCCPIVGVTLLCRWSLYTIFLYSLTQWVPFRTLTNNTNHYNLINGSWNVDTSHSFSSVSK